MPWLSCPENGYLTSEMHKDRSEIGIFDLSFLTFFKKCLLPIKYTHIYAKFIALIKMIT